MRAAPFQLRPGAFGDSNRRSGSPRRRRGFTMMELVLGMIVTGLVMTAVAGLLSAVATGWDHAESVQSSSSYRIQCHTRLQRILKGAKQLGAFRPGSINGDLDAAAIMMWLGDDNGDGQVQFSELGMRAHEGPIGSSGGYLALYEVVYPSNWTEAEKTAEDSPPETDDFIYSARLLDPADEYSFRTMTYVQKTSIVASNVVGAVVTRIDSAAVTRPTLDYMLKFDKDDGLHVEYGTVTLRTAAELPATQS